MFLIQWENVLRFDSISDHDHHSWATEAWFCRRRHRCHSSKPFASLFVEAISFECNDSNFSLRCRRISQSWEKNYSDFCGSGSHIQRRNRYGTGSGHSHWLETHTWHNLPIYSTVCFSLLEHWTALNGDLNLSICTSLRRGMAVIFGRADKLRQDEYWRALIEDCEENGTIFDSWTLGKSAIKEIIMRKYRFPYKLLLTAFSPSVIFLNLHFNSIRFNF